MVLNKLSNLIPAKSSPPSHTSSWNGATDQEPQRVNLLPLPANVLLKFIIHWEMILKHAHHLLRVFPLQCNHYISGYTSGKAVIKLSMSYLWPEGYSISSPFVH